MIIKNESVLNVQTLISCIVAHIKPVNMTDICSSSSFCCFSQLRSGKKKKKIKYSNAFQYIIIVLRMVQLLLLYCCYCIIFLDRQTDICAVQASSIFLLFCAHHTWTRWIVIIILLSTLPLKSIIQTTAYVFVCVCVCWKWLQK